MNRFFALFKKEMRELLTFQMILPVIIGMLVLMFVGNVIGKESTKAAAAQKIIVNDMDSTEASQMVPEILKASGYEVFLYNNEKTDTLIQEAKEKGINIIISIPAGFGEGLRELKPQKIENYSIIKGFSFSTLMGSGSSERVLKTINENLSSILIMKNTSIENPENIKYPVSFENVVVMGNKTANISMEELAGFSFSQSMLIPIVIFLIVITASQTVVVSIASEKENKTLETLLSTPLSRMTIVTAKMTAAGFVSLVMAVIYMFGMRYYINGLTAGALQNQTDQRLVEALNRLGMNLNVADYLLIGTSLFLSILIALAVSLILGVYSEDVKKAQSLITPIIFMIMIPYLVSMFINMDTASPAVKVLINAIPFSHTFFITQNLFSNRNTNVIGGIIYQLLLLLLLIIVAARIFATDRVLTAQIRFNKNNKKAEG